MDQNIIETVQELIRDVFENDTIVINENTIATDVPEWDSFNHVRLMIVIEDHFGVNFPTGEVADLSNVKELISLIEKHIQR